MTERKNLAGRAAGAVVLIALLQIASASAQTQQEIHDTTGFKADRAYFSPEPFEHFDTLSGNLILTFTDLVLPGNGGRHLAFQRTYNAGGRTPESLSRSLWTFGFPGMVMRINTRNWPDFPPTDYDFNAGNGFLVQMWGSTPVLFTADGAAHKTVYDQTPNASIRETLYNVRSNGFLLYNRQTGVLQMPDGTVCQYDAQGRLQSFTDPFSNTVTLAWSPTSLVVTQNLGNGQSRVVTFTLDAATEYPTGMEYDGRIWDFGYTSYEPNGPQLTSVQPPEGLPWQFSYDTTGWPLTGVTTPHDGQITYEYEPRPHPQGCTPPPPMGYESQTVLTSRTRSGPAGTATGTWVIESVRDPGCDIIFRQRVINTPSGRIVDVYDDDVPGMNTSHVILDGGLQLRFREISEGGVILEREEREYVAVPVMNHGSGPFSTYEVAQRAIARGGRTYTTNYTYRTTDFGDYHNAATITETSGVGGATRTTTRTYTLGEARFITGLPATEQLTVGGETFHKSWSYDLNTGFMESATIYGIGTVYTPDTRGNVASITKSNGKQTTFEYSWGQVSAMTTPEYGITRVINPDGTVLSETQAGRTTTSEYDDLSRVTRTTPPGGTHQIRTEYDPAGRWVRISRGTTPANTSVVTTTLDGFGRAIGTENSVGVRTTTRYDAEGRIIYEGYPFAPGVGRGDIGTDVTYDVLGRVKRRTNPDGTHSDRVYGNAVVITTDEGNHSTLQGFEAFGDPDDARLITVLDARNETWHYTYNGIGLLKQVQAPGGSTRTWTYQNGTERLLSETHPESGTTTYDIYDGAGVLKQKTDANGTVFSYSHDGNDRVVSESAGGETTTILYEPGSDLRRRTSTASTSTELVYDAAGRVAQKVDTISGRRFRTGYEYDSNDNMVALRYPALHPTNVRRQVDYEYDSERRLIRVFQGATNYASNLTYHPSGALTGYTAGNGLVTTFAYHQDRYWPTSIAAGPFGLQYQLYDGTGNVGQIGDSRAGMEQTFGYDELGRLVSATSGPAFYGSISYSYDARGNRLTSGGVTYAYDAATQRLSAQGLNTFTYDNNGNLLGAPNTTLSYTKRNMLASAIVVGGTATYAYDAGNLRVKKTASGWTTYFVRSHEQHVLTEWTNPGPTGHTRDYIYAGTRLIAAIKRSSTDDSDLYGEIVPGGPPVSLTFTTPGQRGWLTFEGTAGQRVSAHGLASNRTPSNAYIFAPLRIVRLSDGLIFDSMSDASAAFVGGVELPTTSTYAVYIDPIGNGLGTATITAYDVVDAVAPIAINGPPTQVTLTTPGQRGFLTFAATAGQRISLIGEVANVTAPGWPATLWNDVFILRPDGAELWSDHDGGGRAYFEPVVLPVEGTYTFVFDPGWNATGTATVTLYGFAEATGTITIDGPAVAASLTTPGQNGRLTFSGTQGQRVSAYGVQSNVQSNGTPGGSLWFPLAVLKPDGSQLDAESAGGVRVLIEPAVLPSSGTYAVFIDPLQSTTGTATVSLHQVTDTSGSTSVNGGPVALSLVPGQNASLTFAGTAGQQVTVRMTGNTIGHVQVRLRRPDGTQHASTSSFFTNFTLAQQTLPVNGSYTIEVDPQIAGGGTINVSVTNP